MNEFWAALIGAGIGGGFALGATLLAHLLERNREWRDQLRRTYLEMRTAAMWASYPVFSPEGHEHRLKSPKEAERWGAACLRLPETLLDLRAIIRGRRGWRAELCRRIDILQTMCDAMIKRYNAKGGALGESESTVVLGQLRSVEELVFRHASAPSLDVAEFDRRVDHWIEHGLDATYNAAPPTTEKEDRRFWRRRSPPKASGATE